MTDNETPAPAGEMWVSWYRVEAGPDGLLILGQDDESFGLDDEDGVEFLCHEMNRLWNADHNHARATGDLVRALEMANKGGRLQRYVNDRLRDLSDDRDGLPEHWQRDFDMWYSLSRALTNHMKGKGTA